MEARTEFTNDAVTYFWPALFAVCVLAVVSPGLRPAQARWLWLVGTALTIGAALGTTLIMRRGGEDGSFVAYDLVGSLVANGLTILAATGIGVQLTRRQASPALRAVAVACAALFTLAGSWIVLAVHCLSGDCL